MDSYHTSAKLSLFVRIYSTLIICNMLLTSGHTLVARLSIVKALRAIVCDL